MSDEQDVAVPTPHPVGRLAKIYIKLRDAVTEQTKVLDALEEKKKLVASALKDALVTEGCKSMRTDFGTVTLSKTTRFQTSDWPNFDAWLVTNNLAPSVMLEHRISNKNMATFLEENPGLVPPGLNSETEITVRVTRPK